MAFGLSAGTIALLSAGAGVAGGMIAANATENAADSAAQSADKAGARIDAQYQQTRADQAPYRDAGYTSLAQLGRGTVNGGEFNRDFTMADFNADPGYQFRVQQGEQGINRAATAGGMRYSGATLKALAGYNSNMASQEYGNAYARFNNNTTTRFNRLAAISGIGQTATNATGAAGQVAANGGAKADMAAGSARASGYTGVAGAINGTIGGVVNDLQQRSYLSDLNRSSYADPSYGAGNGGRSGDYSDNAQLYGI